MTRNDSLYDSYESASVSEALNHLIAEYGRLPVLLGALAAAFVRRGPPERTPLGELSTYMRRDIGLPPVPERADWTRLR